MNHEDVMEAFPGDQVAFRVNASADALDRGYVASNSCHDSAMEASSFTSLVIILDHPGQICSGYTPVVDCHTTSIAVRFSELLAKVDRHTGKVLEKNPKFLRKGDAGLVKMIPTRPMVVDFSEYPPLGHFTVRDMRQTQTVAVGVVKSVVKN